MFNVKIDFDEKKLYAAVEKEMKVKGTQEIQRKLRGLVCPDHGRTPTVTAKGTLKGKMSWTVDTCCDKLLELVNARMGARGAGGILKSPDDIFGGRRSVEDILGGAGSVKDILGGSGSVRDILGG